MGKKWVPVKIFLITFCKPGALEDRCRKIPISVTQSSGLGGAGVKCKALRGFENCRNPVTLDTATHS